MPFWKSSNSAEKEKKTYPTQSAAAVPQQATAPPVSGYPQGPPPMYTPVQQGYPQQYPSQYPVAYPGPPAAPAQAAHLQYAQPPQQPYQPPPQYVPQQQTIHVQEGFDAGARFTHATRNIPPPPPGCLPNTAQIAASSGHNVEVTQRPGDFLTGGSDGGYVIW